MERYRNGLFLASAGMAHDADFGLLLDRGFRGALIGVFRSFDGAAGHPRDDEPAGRDDENHGRNGRQNASWQ